MLLIPLGLWIPRLGGCYPLAAEWYAGHIYPTISHVLGALSGLFPFSLAEVSICAVILAAAAMVIVYIIRWLIRRIPFVRLVSLLLTLAITGGALLNVFYFIWGLNYARPTLYELLELPVQERPVEELQALCQALCNEAVALRSQVAEDTAGVYTLPQGWRAAFAEIPQAYEALGQKVPLFARSVRPAKGLIASVGMSYAGLAGIYIPFTAEANVNVHQPALLLLCSAAHESAHYLGIAKEDEANFVAYLACMESNDPAIAYSGVMLALIHATNKLNRAEPEAFMAVRKSYSEGMVRDILAYNAYWESYEGAVEEAVTEINDTYLRHNQQESGVKSYGLMVDLLLAWHFRGE
ncbi:MAG: DUF3810 domain-containing protein [Candidatus Pelethousia sp.]|nr:DUF3810 domain-containing protein [Candidatus Pelethousia sp.]